MTSVQTGTCVLKPAERINIQQLCVFTLAERVLHNIIRHSPTQSSSIGPSGDSRGSNTSRQRKGAIKIWVMREIIAHGNRGRQTGYLFRLDQEKALTERDMIFLYLKCCRSPDLQFVQSMEQCKEYPNPPQPGKERDMKNEEGTR